MTTNTVFTTQTVLCEAPYCLALLYHIHVQEERSLPLQWSKQLVEVLSVSLVHTTSATQFRLHHLQMKSWKYVRWWFHWYNYSNTAEFTSIIIMTYSKSCSSVVYSCQDYKLNVVVSGKHVAWLRWEGGVIIKQAPEDMQYCCIRDPAERCKSCSPYHSAICYCSKLAEVPLFQILSKSYVVA